MYKESTNIEVPCYLKGAGTKRNVTKAIEWLKKALMSNPDCEELSFWYDKANKSKK